MSKRSISIRVASSSVASLCTISPNPTSFRSLVFRRLTSVRLNLSLALTLITKLVRLAFSFMGSNRMGNVEKVGGILRANLKRFEPAGLQSSSRRVRLTSSLENEPPIFGVMQRKGTHGVIVRAIPFRILSPFSSGFVELSSAPIRRDEIKQVGSKSNKTKRSEKATDTHLGSDSSSSQSES